MDWYQEGQDWKLEIPNRGQWRVFETKHRPGVWWSQLWAYAVNCVGMSDHEGTLEEVKALVEKEVQKVLDQIEAKKNAAV